MFLLQMKEKESKKTCMISPLDIKARTFELRHILYSVKIGSKPLL